MLELEARVLDIDLELSERLDALDELRDMPKRYAFVGRDEQGATSLSSSVNSASASPYLTRRSERSSSATCLRSRNKITSVVIGQATALTSSTMRVPVSICP